MTPDFKFIVLDFSWFTSCYYFKVILYQFIE